MNPKKLWVAFAVIFILAILFNFILSGHSIAQAATGLALISFFGAVFFTAIFGVKKLFRKTTTPSSMPPYQPSRSYQQANLINARRDIPECYNACHNLLLAVDTVGNPSYWFCDKNKQKLPFDNEFVAMATCGQREKTDTCYIDYHVKGLR